VNGNCRVFVISTMLRTILSSLELPTMPIGNFARQRERFWLDISRKRSKIARYVQLRFPGGRTASLHLHLPRQRFVSR